MTLSIDLLPLIIIAIILIIRYIDARGEYTKNYFPYRFMNEDEIIDMVLRSLY